MSIACSTGTWLTKIVVLPSVLTSLSKTKLRPVWRARTSKTILVGASRNWSDTGRSSRVLRRGTAAMGPRARSIFACSALAAAKPGSSPSTACTSSSAASSFFAAKSCAALAVRSACRRSACTPSRPRSARSLVGSIVSTRR